MSKSLPQVGVQRNPDHYAAWGHATFIDAVSRNPQCPCCGANLIGAPNEHRGWQYECGAEYTPKPQCQCHTDVYWGSCPVGDTAMVPS